MTESRKDLTSRASSRPPAPARDRGASLTLNRARALIEEERRGMIFADLEGRIKQANEAAERIFGRTAGDLAGDDLFWLLREQVADAADIIERFEMESQGVRDAHTSLTRPDSSTKRVEITLRHVREADTGKPLEILLLVTDEDALLVDPLTGIGNRLEFQARQREELVRLHRGQLRNLSLLLLDVDHFKMVNDTHGHQGGDAVLQAVAKAMAGCVRRLDTVARVGGEEIAVLLPDADADGARLLAERIRRQVEALRVVHGGAGIKVTCSLGVATVSGGDIDPAARPEDMLAELSNRLYARSDAALYMAKHEGRNRVCQAA